MTVVNGVITDGCELNVSVAILYLTNVCIRPGFLPA